MLVKKMLVFRVVHREGWQLWGRTGSHAVVDAQII